MCAPSRPALWRAGIRYLHMPALWGLRHAKPSSLNTAWRNAGFRGFADYMQTPEFACGLRGLMKLARARRANSSKETFYSRFPAKESLFVAVIERRMKSVLEDVTPSLPREVPMEDTLRGLARAFSGLSSPKNRQNSSG
jgi:hypothetical protein